MFSTSEPFQPDCNAFVVWQCNGILSAIHCSCARGIDFKLLTCSDSSVIRVCIQTTSRLLMSTHAWHASCRKLVAIGQSDSPTFLKNLQRLPVFERFAAELLQLFIGKAVPSGADGVDSSAPIMSY